MQQSFRIERLLSENAAEGEVACSMLAQDASRKAADWSVDGEVEFHGTSPSGGPMKQSRNQSTPGTDSLVCTCEGGPSGDDQNALFPLLLHRHQL